MAPEQIGRSDPAPGGGINRRRFFVRSASAAAGAAALGGGIFDGILVRSAYAAAGGQREGPGYGPLSPAGDELALPRGFRYSIVSTEGELMEDGYPVPKAMDGMAAFP